MTTFKRGDLVKNTISGADWTEVLLGRVLEVCENGDLILLGHGLREGGSKWRADAAKCEPFEPYVTETLLCHKDGFVCFG